MTTYNGITLTSTLSLSLLRARGFRSYEPDDKMTKGWSPRASDITVSVSELCELSSTAPLYCGRKRHVIDYARRTFGARPPQKAD